MAYSARVRNPTAPIALATLAVALTLGGCGHTTYRPTAPRPALGPGVQVDVVSIRGAAHEAEAVIRSQQAMTIGPVSWASGDVAPCTATHVLPVGRKVSDELTLLPDQFQTASADDIVFVQMKTDSGLARRDLFLDFKVDTGEAQGCLRVPLTAAGDETLWRADRRPWSLNAGFRVDEPLGRLEGTGLRLSLSFRALFPVGPVRPFFGFSFGVAGCRGADCPPVSFSDNEDEGSQGFFGTFGGELGVERRTPIGRWSISLALGGNLSVFHLGAPPDYPGDTNAGVGGPFASLTLFGPGADAIPGFSPTARRGAHGPELYFARQIAFGRGPNESAWVAGFGWRVEGTQ